MTEREKIIVSAYTGFLMCDFKKVHQYAQELLGRQIYTHEMKDADIQAEIHEKSMIDFLKICREETEPPRVGYWTEIRADFGLDRTDFKVIMGKAYRCSKCGAYKNIRVPYDYCPNCKATMKGVRRYGND